MRIVINSKSISSIKTGIGHYTYHLANNLKKINYIDVDLFGLDNRPSHTKKNQYYRKLTNFIRDYIPYSYKFYVSFCQYKFNKTIQDKKYDLYHETNNLCYKSDLKTILTVHDLSVVKYPDMHPKKRVNDFNKRFVKSIYSAKKIIVDCHSVKKELIKIYGLPKKNIEVIYLASRFQKRFKKNSSTLKKFHSNRGINYKKYFISVGTLEPRKNILNVIKSYMQLPKKVRNSHPLFLIGSQGWRLSIPNDLYDESVNFIGYINDDELECFYHGATGLICLSLYEGFGLPPLEAMSCGTATLLSNNDCFKELYSNASIMVSGNNILSIKEQLLKLSSDEFFRKKYEALGLNYSKKFSWHKTAQKTALVYKSLDF